MDRPTFHPQASRRRGTRLQFTVLVRLILMLATLKAVPASGQTGSLRGFVTDASDGQALPGANVVLDAGDRVFLGAAADNDGFFAIGGIAAGEYILTVSFIGYQAQTDTLRFADGTILTINVVLEPALEELDEIVVDAERTVGAARVLAGLQTVLPAEIDRIPAPDVSGDLASYLTILPGFVTVGDQGGQFFVRGGEPWQNMVMIDGMLIYQPFHILGYYSSFPTDIMSSVDIYAGGFGARYGGRISSVIDISTRSGNKKRVVGAVTLSPFLGGIRLEGPLDPKLNLSFLVSYRHSLIEQAATYLIERPVPFDFSDLYVKLHSTPSKASRVSINMLRTTDRGKIGEDIGLTPLAEVRWENRAFGFRYLVLPNYLPLVAEFNVGVSRVKSELGPEEEPIRSAWTSRVNTSADVTFYSGLAEVHWGLFARTINLNSELGGLFQDLSTDKEWVTEVGIYGEPEFKPLPGLRVAPSLRIHAFPSKSATYFEPRVRAHYEKNRQRFSAAFGLYHQEIMGIGDRRDATSVFTAWATGPDKAGVPQSTHAILGYNYRASSRLDFSMEVYRKWYSNLFVAEWTAFPRLTTRLQRAEGRVIGMDLRAEYKSPRFYGMINYGLSSVEYDAQQTTLELWFGTSEYRFRPAHDRRHQLNALAGIQVVGFDVTARWQFGSGLPYNRALGFDGFVLVDRDIDVFEVAGSRRVIYEKPFNGILPTYHRLDLSVERAFQLRGFKLTLQASALNAYDRQNIFYLDVFTLQRADQLPFIPSFGLKVETE